jgi:hypothetical protein
LPYVNFLTQNFNKGFIIMKLKNYIITTMFLFGLAIPIGCQKKLPDGFPTNLVSFDVKLTHDGSPIKGAAVSFLLEGRRKIIVPRYGIYQCQWCCKNGNDDECFLQIGRTFGNLRGGDYSRSRAAIQTCKCYRVRKNEQCGIRRLLKKNDAEIAAMPHPVPKEWGSIKTTLVKITVPEKGGNVTIEITD